MKELRLYIFRLLFIVCSILIMASCYEKKQFDGYLYPIRENGLYGYIDSVGNRIIEPEFLWASTFHNGLAMAVVDTIYREFSDSMAYEVGERDTIINQPRLYAKYGYIDKNGRFAITPSLVCYIILPEKSFIIRDLDDCRRVLSRHIFQDKRALFYDTVTWKSGYINTKGNISIKPLYYDAEPFGEGLAVVKDKVAEPLFTNKACITPSRLRCAYMDTLGNAITEFKYEFLTRFCSGRGIGNYKKIKRENVDIADTTIVWETYSIPRFLINKDGKEIKELDFNYDYYGFGKDGISVSSDGFFIRSFVGKENISYCFIDINGDFLEPLKGLYEYQLDSLEKCNDIMQVLPENAQISAATYFNDGFAGISPDKKHWFVIDKYLLIHGYGEESIFDGFRAFNHGLAAIKKNGKWGFINRKMKEQIPCKYDSCGFVYPYLEEVFEYNIQGEVKKKAYINRKDSLVWESAIQSPEEITNNYSNKEKKDWGKWTYNYSILKQIPLGAYGATAFVLLLVIVICAMIIRSPQRKETELVIVSPTQIITEKEEIISTPLTNNEEIEDDRLYPSVGQYAETIKLAAITPEEYFDKLSHLRPVLDDNGEPIMSSGNFAVVFKMKDENGKQYAVRCFHRAQQGREKNYKLICEELAKVSSPYLSPIRYYEKELFVESDEYPVLLMDWVDGMTLDKYIRKVINDKRVINQLAVNFRKLAVWLLSQPFAHGDLKPDNIIVREDGSLVLVDYDGMFVPAMQGQKAREIGSPDFRNPSRTENDFNKGIDNFPLISILLSLELLIENKDFLTQFGEVDRLLFSEQDYRDIEKSKLYKRAYSTYNEDVSELALMLKSQLYHNCNEDLITFLQRKEKRDKNKHTNERIEKRINAIVIIYNLLVPLSVFCYSRIVPEYNWNLIGVSLIVLISAILLYLIITILDIFRPYKKHHLYIDEDYTSWGCIFTLFDFLIPMRGLMSSYYNGSWYYTLLIIAIWICFFNIVGAIIYGAFELRKSIFMTPSEMIIEQEERDKAKVRNELRIEEEQQKKIKETEGQKRILSNDDLPF